MPRRLTSEQLEYIKAHINDYPRKKVAKNAGVTIHTLYRYVELFGGNKKDKQLGQSTIDKIASLYEYKTATEISKMLNVPKSTIMGYAWKLRLQHNEETLHRISDERGKSLMAYWTEARYKEKGAKHHRKYKAEELRILSGKPQLTKLKIRKLYPKALNAKMYLRKRYNYFYSDGEPFVLCYDKETKRHPKEQYYSDKFGFKFVAASDFDNSCQPAI